MEKILQFREVKGERSRTYLFPGGEALRFEEVVRICIRPSGTHRLELASGIKLIVPPHWIAIEIEAQEWSL